MKKIIFLIIPLVLLGSLLVACSEQSSSSSVTKGKSTNSNKIEKDIREIAYDQLSSQSKDRIEGTWRDGKLSKVTLSEIMGSISEKAYIGKEVYLVDFPTKSKSIPNNMILYLGMDNNKLIGFGYVD